MSNYMDPTASAIAPANMRPIARKAIARSTSTTSSNTTFPQSDTTPGRGAMSPASDMGWMSRRSTADFTHLPNNSLEQNPGLSRTDTAASVGSASSRSSMASAATPLSPYTNITSPSPLSSPAQATSMLSLDNTMQPGAVPSYFALCTHCKGGIPQANPTIRCLICSSANRASVIPNFCFQCYSAKSNQSGHEHDISFYACDLDSLLSDTQIPQQAWIVRRNASKRLWYESRSTGYKTFMRPMTAVCGLPQGWQERRDPEGFVRGALPPGWREAKDPDGKLFFVHDELQLASWFRPGQQPPVSRNQSAARASAQAAISNNGVVTFSPRPSVTGNPANANLLAAKPVGTVQSAVVRPTQQQVTLATATEATINLIDPTDGAIIRNTKIAAHIAGQGVKGTVKAVKHNKRLQNFARGTGIAAANRSAKKAWRKAAKEVDTLDLRGKQEIKITQTGTQGQGIIVEEADDGFDGEYVVEYDDGTLEYYDANGTLRRTVAKQRPSLPASGVVNPPQQVTVQQPTHYASTQQTVGRPATVRPIGQQKQSNPLYTSTQDITLYADQPLYSDQGTNVYVDQTQNVIADQSITIDQNVYIEQGVSVMQNQSFVNQDITTCQEMDGQQVNIEYEYDVDEVTTECQSVQLDNCDTSGDVGSSFDF